MEKMNRKHFIKLGVISGTSLLAFRYFSDKQSGSSDSFFMITDNPLQDPDRLLKFINFNKVPVINIQRISAAKQDLTLLRKKKIFDPVKLEANDQQIAAFTTELRNRKYPGTHLVLIEENNEELNSVTFQVNNVIVEKIQLVNEYKNIIIQGMAGPTAFNLTNGRLSVTKVSCRHSVCKRMGGVENGKIVCVPNKLIASINRKNNRGIDAMTG